MLLKLLMYESTVSSSACLNEILRFRRLNHSAFSAWKNIDEREQVYAENFRLRGYEFWHFKCYDSFVNHVLRDLIWMEPFGIWDQFKQCPINFFVDFKNWKTHLFDSWLKIFQILSQRVTPLSGVDFDFFFFVKCHQKFDKEVKKIKKSMLIFPR